MRSVDPDPESAPWQVHSTGKSVLLAHPDDPSVLGTGPGGTPLLMTLGATSLICVPISDGSTGYGALTLARQAANGPVLGRRPRPGRGSGPAPGQRDPGRPDVPPQVRGGRIAAGEPDAGEPADGAVARVRGGLHRRHAVVGDQRGLLRRVPGLRWLGDRDRRRLRQGPGRGGDDGGRPALDPRPRARPRRPGGRAHRRQPGAAGGGLRRALRDRVARLPAPARRPGAGPARRLRPSRPGRGPGGRAGGDPGGGRDAARAVRRLRGEQAGTGAAAQATCCSSTPTG